MPSPTELALLAIVLAAYTVGTALGFGTSILVVTFAAQLLPLDVLVPFVAPLNVALSSYIAVRHRRQVQWRQLGRRIVPLVGLGVPLGLLLFNLRELAWLKLVFALFVVTLAALQLRLSLKRVSGGELPLQRLPAAGLLWGGGIVHGLFGTGGPLIVYVLGREMKDKGAFRASLGAMFVPMTTALIVDYVLVGLMTPQVLRLVAMAAPVMLMGIWFGELAHRRVDDGSFKRAVWALLLVGGLVLSARAAAGL